MVKIIILLLFTTILFMIHIISNYKEKFTHTNFLFNNIQLGTKKNMSRDIRGDPIIIPRMYTPWLQGTITPIYNKPLQI